MTLLITVELARFGLIKESYLKNQWILFVKVLWVFGHFYFGVNVTFLSEILASSMRQIAEFTPPLLQAQLYQEMGYAPGGPLELPFRILGAVLMALALYNTWLVAKYPQQIKRWRKPALIQGIVMIHLYAFILIEEIQVNVLHNSLFLAIFNIIIFSWSFKSDRSTINE